MWCRASHQWITRVHRALARTAGDAVHVRIQLPIVLDDWSEPEPDIAVCKVDPYGYTRAHPESAEVLCGVANEPGEKFCGGCGVALTAPRLAQELAG